MTVLKRRIAGKKESVSGFGIELKKTNERLVNGLYEQDGPQTCWQKFQLGQLQIGSRVVRVQK